MMGGAGAVTNSGQTGLDSWPGIACEIQRGRHGIQPVPVGSGFVRPLSCAELARLWIEVGFVTRR